MPAVPVGWRPMNEGLVVGSIFLVHSVVDVPLRINSAEIYVDVAVPAFCPDLSVRQFCVSSEITLKGQQNIESLLRHRPRPSRAYGHLVPF